MNNYQSMGISLFFNLAVKSGTTSESIVTDLQERIHCTHLYLDFNATIHPAKAHVLRVINSNLLALMLLATSKKKYDLPEHNKEFLALHKIKESTDLNKIGKMFNKKFSNDYVGKMVIDQTVKSLFFVVQKYFYPEELKLIYISIDGVPSKGKMLEQRSRRYIDAVTTQYPLALFKSEYEQDASKLESAYRTYRIDWGGSKITPGTQFMEEMSFALKSIVPSSTVFGNSKINYVVSDVHECGEGEKKIIESIKVQKFKESDSITILCPDADMIIFLMLLDLDIRINILRHDQQKSTNEKDVYGLIRINSFCDALVRLVQDGNPSTNYSYRNICDDLALAFTVFGNDFVPKIQTVSSDMDIGRVLSAYQETLYSYKVQNAYLTRKYLLKDGTVSYNLSFSFLRAFCNRLLLLEHEYISTYKLVDKFGAHNAGSMRYILQPRISPFNFFETVNDAKELITWYKKLLHDVTRNNDVSKYELDEYRMNMLKRAFESDKRVPMHASHSDLIILLKTIISNKEKPPMIPYKTFPRSIGEDIYYHKTAINELDTPFKKEEYRFNNMIGPYALILGNDEISYSDRDQLNYYRNHFEGQECSIDINQSTAHNSDGNLNDWGMMICQQYISGVLWVFEYYFNGDAHPSKYSYPFDSAPMMRDIVSYLGRIDKNEFKSLQNIIVNNVVTKLSTFMNPVEQFLYVCPLTESNYYELPVEYKEFLETTRGKEFIKKYFIDTKAIVQDILDHRMPARLCKTMSCSGVRYINKCHILGVDRLDEDYDKNFMYDLRHAIKTKSKDTKKREMNTYPLFERFE